MPLQHIDEIINDSFGLWISSLFSAIGGRNPDISFEHQKEAFFWLIEYLLKNEKIKFLAPGMDCYISPNNPHPEFTINDLEAHWKASPQAIVSYLRERWPSTVSDANDIALTTYFYEIPGVIWVGDNGQLIAS